ncbi:hypothetical protein CR513_39452, partial [Mucuna pruriens]
MSEKEINPINPKNWKTPSKLYYQRPTTPDLLLEEQGENNFKSFNANNIYEWNIDTQTEYNIMSTLQHMSMVATAYQTAHDSSEDVIVNILSFRIYWALERKTDLDGKVIINDDNEDIPDTVNTLICIIAQHFIGDPSLWKDRSIELLSNPKCRTLADFRWYRDTFLTMFYTTEDSQQPFWKEKFLASLPRSLGDKVRDKIRSQSANGDIPYDSLSYGLLISYIQQEDNIQKIPKKPTAKIVCYNCGKQGHISKYYRLKKKIRNLNLEPNIEEQINNLIETSEEESEKKSSDEDLNQIQQDEQVSSSEEEETPEINTLTKVQDLLFEVIDYISDPQEKKVFLNKLKKTLETKPKQKEFITNNKFDQEVKELKQQQNIHQIILSQFEGHSADSNCILEGLIPTKFFAKTSEKLSTASGSKLKINYKLSNAIIGNQGFMIKTNFLLVKNLKNEIILRRPFIKALFSLQISKEGITTAT